MAKEKKTIVKVIVVLVVIIVIFLLVNFCSKESDNKVKVYSDVKGVNVPILASGMKAIKWSGESWVEVNDPDKDTSWYDYKIMDEGDLNTSNWANAKTSDGSMWVWIPRYAYKIIENSIDIIFLENNQTKIKVEDGTHPFFTSKVENGGYIIHPAFTSKVENGGWDKEIPGFWISKFEAGLDENKNLIFKANEFSYNNVDISTSYSLCKSLTYNKDSAHLLKNSEWGAAAYLAQSAYGRNGIEVSMNTTQVIISKEESYAITAGGNGVDARANSEEAALTLNVNQSTTGNVYGVYDMSGGLWERVAAYINNGHENLMKNGSSLLTDINQSTKYITVYDCDKNNDEAETNYTLNQNIKGDAMFETSKGLGEKSWFGDYSSFMFDKAPFLHRGGTTTNTTGVGIFAFSNTPGQSYKALGFRCAIVIE